MAFSYSKGLNVWVSQPQKITNLKGREKKGRESKILVSNKINRSKQQAVFTDHLRL